MESSAISHFLRALIHVSQGIPLTLQLTAFSVFLGFLLAVPLAIIRARKSTWGARAVGGYIFFFTGTPLLVQVYIFYKGMPEFDWVVALMQVEAFSFLQDGFFWALLAFTLNTAAYSTEIFSGAIRNTPHGEIEAGRAYGLSSFQLMSKIVFPSSLRRALPAYSNEVVMMLQSTALASTVTLFEVTGMALDFNAKFYRPFPAFLAAALIYLILTSALVYTFRILEKRYLAHLHIVR